MPPFNEPPAEAKEASAELSNSHASDNALDEPAISACTSLIREALKLVSDLTDIDSSSVDCIDIPAANLQRIEPCLTIESLRSIGIRCSDEVGSYLIRYPRIKLNRVIKDNRLQLPVKHNTVQADPTNTPAESLHSSIVDYLATLLGQVYWAARNCANLLELRKIEDDTALRLNRESLNREAIASAPVERAISKERLMQIDLSQYDDLVTYPGEVNWARERAKILFLQTAARLGLDLQKVFQKTKPFFGRILNSPFGALVELRRVEEPFCPPPFDIARQTTQDWVRKADRAWERYRDNFAEQMSDWRTGLLANGILKEFKQRRRPTDLAASKKARIAEESAVFEWAVRYFLCAQSWAEIAQHDPLVGPPSRRRRDQIRKRTTQVLKELGLPRRK